LSQSDSRATAQDLKGSQILQRISETMDTPLGDEYPLNEVIRTTLGQRAGRLPDAHATAEATAVTWRLVAAQLTPVIGARGLDVLFSRALHLASVEFP
jgi:hypothetical protein